MGTLGAKVCSKAAGGGQWAAALLALVAVGPAACSRHSQAPQPAAGQAGGRQTPSGFPVPRYVSTKFDKVNARVGPGDDYAVKWVYRVKGLPLQVVAETEEWRRVCDSDGSLSWVRGRTTDARHTVMRTQPQDLALHARPDDASPAVATLVGHAMAELKECQGVWCRLSVGHARGWARADEVWGTASAPQCR
ncbi:SH3 domain-containing protein [Caulobacter sp. S45]|uniref:SH3 domain-containing protein n=1 Tax=Caulobacter sp. S45 TaxID=1641861 RepID=UPI001576B91C|nr:SH3 domain-containing protein [Caulobacter sp. S45]